MPNCDSSDVPSFPGGSCGSRPVTRLGSWLGIALLVAGANGVAAAQDAGERNASAFGPVTGYPVEYFAKAQPFSAFDMLAHLPGYKFSESDVEVRGFAGSSGNVLIDGRRPATKNETLESLLRRIPAGNVARVELLRAGAPGVDMQGQSVLANIVRVDAARIRGSAEAGNGYFERGITTPRMAAEVSRRTADSLVELSARQYEEVDDEKGVGHRPRVTPAGEVIRETDFVQDEGLRATEVAAAYELGIGAGKLRMNGLFKDVKEGANIREVVTFPTSTTQDIHERERARSTEFGMNFSRPVFADSQLELFALRRDIRLNESDLSLEVGGTEEALTNADSSETILRGILRRSAGAWVLDGGAEAAVNVHDTGSALNENGIDVPLPAADVRIEEHRVEAFATATWRSTRWILEFGSRFESSRLELEGDSDTSRDFFFVKPNASLSWSATPSDQLRLAVLREVGQLDFADFGTSSSLASGVVTAGNPDLEPDRTWRMEVSWERQFAGGGDVVLKAARERISDLIDRFPLFAADSVFDGVGNIGDGRRDELSMDLNVPLERAGIAGGLIKASAVWRDSEVRDPATGLMRAISEDRPFEATLLFTQDIARLRGRWGLEVTAARELDEFKFNQVITKAQRARADLFCEYRSAGAWSVRLDAKNLGDRRALHIRDIHGGVRGSAPLLYTETRTLRLGPSVELSARWNFGD